MFEKIKNFDFYKNVSKKNQIICFGLLILFVLLMEYFIFIDGKEAGLDFSNSLIMSIITIVIFIVNIMFQVEFRLNLSIFVISSVLIFSTIQSEIDYSQLKEKVKNLEKNLPQKEGVANNF